MKTEILFVTELKLHPTYGGQFIRGRNILESLCQNFEVVVLAPKIDSTCELVKKAAAWYPLPAYRRSGWARINNFRHRLMMRAAWKSQLKIIYQKHKPQLTWFDYEHWGQYVPYAHKWGTLAIMDTHNTQSNLTKQRFRARSFGQTYMIEWLRYWAQRFHERVLFPQFDRIISVSEIDRQYHANFVPDKYSLLLPNYINENDYCPKAPPKRADNLIILTGNFNSFQNNQGLAWFLQQIWPYVVQHIPEAQLQLVGYGSDKLTNKLQAYRRITCIGETASVAPYLHRATLAVVPLLHGSGTRFKILEALACETPVVSTTLGAQGLELTPNTHIVLADTAVDFAQAIISLLDTPCLREQLSRNGLEQLKAQYSFDVNTQRLQKIIKETINQ